MNPYLKSLNRIECIITWNCTGRCKHCSEGAHPLSASHLNGEKAAAAVLQIAEKYPIQSLMIFGGEPLLHPEITAQIHLAAKEAGIAKRQIITNGFFSKDPARIREVAGLLKEAGVNDLMLSVDAFHQETIPLEPVMVFAESLLGENVPLRIQPAWLVSEAHDNPWNRETHRLLQTFADLGLPIHEGNVIFPEGNALLHFKEYFDRYGAPENPYVDDPENLTSISLEPDGTLLQGNFYQTPALSILENYHPSCIE